MANPYPTLDPKDLVAYGRVRRTHGNQGEISVSLASSAWEELEPEFLFLLIDEIPVPYRVENIRGGGEQFIVGLGGIDSLTDAETLVGRQIQIHRDELPEDSSDMHLTLEGFTLLSGNHEPIGTIVAIDATTANTLLLVTRGDDVEVTIPLVEEWITAIDAELHTITMDFPIELLNL